MKRISLLKIVSILLLISSGAFAQNKEGYNWYFGTDAGMTWNTTQSLTVPILNSSGQPSGVTKMLPGLPVPLAGSAMGTQTEGVFAMSTANGELMFYSNGMTIWNKTIRKCPMARV